MLQDTGIACADLEESTKELPRQVKEEVTKKPFMHFLEEIYYVRKKQEAFERGEIGMAVSFPAILEIPLNSFPRPWKCARSENTQKVTGQTTSKAAQEVSKVIY